MTDVQYFAVCTCLTVLLLPFFITLFLYVAVELFILVEKYDNMNIIAASITDKPPPSESPQEETQSRSEETEGLDTPMRLREERLTVKLKTSKYIEANVYDYKAIRRVDPNLFQSMNFPAVVMTFCSCTCYSLCVLACEYIITASMHAEYPNGYISAAYSLIHITSTICFISTVYGAMVTALHYENSVMKEIWPFFVSYILSIFACPVMLMLGIWLSTIVISYISAGQIDFRVYYCHLLPSVHLVKAESVHPPKRLYKFWVLSNAFHIRLKSPFGSNKDMKHYIDRTKTTHLLSAIIGLSFLFATTYLVQTNLGDLQLVQTPATSSSCEGGYNCFENYNLVECANITNVTAGQTLLCFRFQITKKRSLSEVASSFGTTASIYFAAVYFFKLTITTVSVLHLLRHTKLWGIVLITIAFLVFAFSIIYMGIDLTGDPSVKLNITLVSFYILIVGAILVGGRVLQVVSEPDKFHSVIVSPEHYLEGVDYEIEREQKEWEDALKAASSGHQDIATH